MDAQTAQATFENVISTPATAFKELPDEVIVVAATYAASAEGASPAEALTRAMVLMLGVELGLREAALPDSESLVAQVMERVMAE